MASLAARVLDIVPWMQARAETLDRDAAFPGDEIDRLSRIGTLSLPLPVIAGARDDTLADQLTAVLTLAGCGNLSVGRILEAHVNALHLISRYGTAEQFQHALQDARDGHLFALW